MRQDRQGMRKLVLFSPTNPTLRQEDRSPHSSRNICMSSSVSTEAFSSFSSCASSVSVSGRGYHHTKIRWASWLSTSPRCTAWSRSPNGATKRGTRIVVDVRIVTPCVGDVLLCIHFPLLCFEGVIGVAVIVLLDHEQAQNV